MRNNNLEKIKNQCIRMSAANSSAKKRRAPPSTEPMKPTTVPNTPMNSPANVGLTLPQVISLIDKRLVSLETVTKTLASQPIAQSTDEPEIPELFMEEFQARFDIMADEIANLKNIVLKLQSYTMDVNKILLEQSNVSAHIESLPKSIPTPTPTPIVNLPTTPKLGNGIKIIEEKYDEDTEDDFHPVTTIKWSEG